MQRTFSISPVDRTVPAVHLKRIIVLFRSNTTHTSVSPSSLLGIFENTLVRVTSSSGEGVVSGFWRDIPLIFVLLRHLQLV